MVHTTLYSSLTAPQSVHCSNPAPAIPSILAHLSLRWSPPVPTSLKRLLSRALIFSPDYCLGLPGLSFTHPYSKLPLKLCQGDLTPGPRTCPSRTAGGERRASERSLICGSPSLASSPNHPLATPVRGKTVFRETGPWYQKGRGRLLQGTNLTAAEPLLHHPLGAPAWLRKGPESPHQQTPFDLTRVSRQPHLHTGRLQPHCAPLNMVSPAQLHTPAHAFSLLELLFAGRAWLNLTHYLGSTRKVTRSTRLFCSLLPLLEPRHSASTSM